jgi:hypothetical protein
MASSVGASSSQSTTNAASNTSTVNGYGSVTITVGNFYGLQSYGRVWIGGQNYDIAGPTSMSQGQSWEWSASRGYTHDANGYRGDVGVSVEFWVNGTSYHAGSAGAATQGAVDYDRKPDAPSSVSPVLNADRTMTITSNAVTSYASTAQYYIGWSQSSDGGGTWGAWSSYEALAATRTKTYAVNALSPGYTYRWRMYASNSDGSSAATTSGNLFYPSSGKRTDGTTWSQMLTAKRYDGSSWVDISTAKRYDGSNWVNLS